MNQFIKGQIVDETVPTDLADGVLLAALIALQMHGQPDEEAAVERFRSRLQEKLSAIYGSESIPEEYRKKIHARVEFVCNMARKYIKRS
ncbi:hypothetical protein N6G02_23355 [Cupriavidus gilardii]|uniref:hypothetical protein n=1 Tax=Cupriavidus gilardii TaxID=82541 RepID=UPI0021C08E4C|nr:hypothetical protein [Cupriavidus gilardii]MCT9119087.1 hypothetical protein [Cupriavidus gilardii]